MHGVVSCRFREHCSLLVLIAAAYRLEQPDLGVMQCLALPVVDLVAMQRHALAGHLDQHRLE